MIAKPCLEKNVKTAFSGPKRNASPHLERENKSRTKIQIYLEILSSLFCIKLAL